MARFHQRQSDSAFEMGKRARRLGKKREDNPYMPEHYAYQAWYSGWELEDTLQRKNEKKNH